ncbi:MAG: hypothetical protein F4X80_07625 [Chloroflexi bacterium]|nr:hypothetical protein [Chloroflexota bacterium]
MDWRRYLILSAVAAVLIGGVAAGLYYGYYIHEEPVAEFEPWPADIKAQMVDGCVQQTIATEEQCACTLDYYEQNASFSLYLEWSAKAFSGHPPGDEKYRVFELGGLHCAETIIVTPTPVTQ